MHSDDCLLLPPPRHLTFIGDTTPLHLSSPTVGFARRNAFRTAIRRELGAGAAAPGDADVVCHGPDGVPPHLEEWTRRPEGYALRLGPRAVHVWYGDDAGALYAAMTLRQLRRRFNDAIPCLEIGDAPVLAHRGVQLSFPQGHTAYRPAYMRRLVPRLARWKINALYLYLESYFDFPSLPHLAGPGAMTPAQARSLDRLCRAYNIRLVPQLNLLAHCGELLATQRYQHLTEAPPDTDPRLVRPFNLCAGDPAVERLVDGMLDDLCDCFTGDLLHVGGDEVGCMGECPRCRDAGATLGKTGLYIRYFSRVRDRAGARGKRIGIWGDMLLHHGREAAAAAREKLFAPFREGTVIYDWHYSGGSPETLAFFVDSGFATVACSSTHLCYCNSLWPGQQVNQRDLFRDAVAAGALGGMSTAWANFTGLHEEQFNYLHATGAVALWSGPTDSQLAPGLDQGRFEQAYNLQRYGTHSDALTRFWHVCGDARGPILSVLAPLHGVNVRKCLYHTDNVLTFWKHYCHLLRGDGLDRFRTGVRAAREAWERVAGELSDCDDPYLPLQAGPLLMFEHLLARFEMSERLFALYDRAAQAQYTDDARFREFLERAAQCLEAHLDHFRPIESYLTTAHRQFGLEKSSMLRLRATRRNIGDLAAFLRYLKRDGRPLPAFQHLHDVFGEAMRTNWYMDREHDWATGPARFQRYSLLTGPWPARAAQADLEL